MEYFNVYECNYTANLWPKDEKGFLSLGDKQVGVLQFNFNGPALPALKLLKEVVEEAIKQAEQNPW